ncbi:MAG: peroxide stress protein YaaA, partial [Pusillimonas sp.]
SFYAKRARGLMARYIVDHRIDGPEQLKGFNVDGYAFYPEASTDLKLVFRRPEQ